MSEKNVILREQRILNLCRWKAGYSILEKCFETHKKRANEYISDETDVLRVHSFSSTHQRLTKLNDIKKMAEHFCWNIYLAY